MQWSKLKARVKSFIVPSLRDRIDFHVTSYRASHDEAEKAWVTVDGKQVFVASWYRHQLAGAARTRKGTLQRDGRGRPMWDDKLPASITMPEQLEQHRPQQFGDALRAYLDMPIADALQSSDPFILALALVDRRLGKNRIAANKPDAEQHSLVQLFYRLRLQSESLN